MNADLRTVYETHQALKLGGKNGTSEKLVPGDGCCPAKIMIIGEAPGEIEDEIGKPFQGPSGRILDRLLGFSHVKRQDVFVTNAFKYRPPENRDPFPSELIASFPCLAEEVSCVNPRVIILTGKVAVSAFFPGKMISSLRGQVLQKGNRRIVCTYHPAVIGYNPSSGVEAVMKADFRLAVETSKSKS